MKSPIYPDPPWSTHGYAAFRAYRVPVADLDLPPGFEVKSRFGYSVGLVGFVRYVAPSPLTYAELIWMPAQVRVAGRVGWYVERMHVDCERSLAAGREIWALPKTLADFDERDGEVSVRTADGTRVDLSFSRLGPGIPGRSVMKTIQANGGETLSFAANTRAKAHLARVRVTDIDIAEKGWESFRRARPLPAPGGMLSRFETTMNLPRPIAG